MPNTRHFATGPSLVSLLPSWSSPQELQIVCQHIREFRVLQATPHSVGEHTGTQTSGSESIKQIHVQPAKRFWMFVLWIVEHEILPGEPVGFCRRCPHHCSQHWNLLCLLAGQDRVDQHKKAASDIMSVVGQLRDWFQNQWWRRRGPHSCQH